MRDERLAYVALRCATCGLELMPVVLPDGEIADLCPDCEVWRP